MTQPLNSPPTFPVAPSEDPPGRGGAGRTAAQLITGCRWIDGDVQTPDWRYCQLPRLRGRSYCGTHHARSINPDGDPQFMAEQAECDHYMRDLLPAYGEFDDEIDGE
ncbi:MAG: hypothetical protein O2967_03405 [Proteobacteria bacterium]|nr:hypothetical protein [Pseudomonadota bacterium]